MLFPGLLSSKITKMRVNQSVTVSTTSKRRVNETRTLSTRSARMTLYTLKRSLNRRKSTFSCEIKRCMRKSYV